MIAYATIVLSIITDIYPMPLTKFQEFCFRLTLTDYQLVHVLADNKRSIYRSVFPRQSGYAGSSRDDDVFRPTEDAACKAIRHPFQAALLVAPDFVELGRRKERTNALLTLKTCARCLELKKVSEFTRKFDAKDKLHPYCKACRNLMKRQSEREKAYQVIAMPTVEKRKKAA